MPCDAVADSSGRMQTGQMRARRLIAAMVVGAGCLMSSCTTSGRTDGSVSLSMMTASSAIGDQGKDLWCVDTARMTDAISGQIHAGPFDLNHGRWTQAKGTKLWVGSGRPGPNTGAVLRAVSLDEQRQEIEQQRSPESAGGVRGLALFFPGALRLPQAGNWRLEVTIGNDTGCFLIDA